MIPNGSPPEEPSVLDWVKSVLRGRPIPVPTPGAARPETRPIVAQVPKPIGEARAAPEIRIRGAQVRLPAAILLILVAQFGLESFEPRSGTPTGLTWILVAGIGLLIWSVRRGDIAWLQVGEAAGPVVDSPVRGRYLLAGAILSLVAFLLSWGNTFRTAGVLAWVAAIVLLMAGFWEGASPLSGAWPRLRAWLRSPRLAVVADGWALAFWLGLGLAGIFRFYHLDTLPLDMWSDQAEKLLDVMDILNGNAPVFFLRNTGREPLQFYLAAATASLLGTGLTFVTLKIGTALAGWLTLPFIYLFGRELGGRGAGLGAMILAGVAFWPNVIARTGLRFALLPAFAAPAIFFLVRGLRLQRRNDLLLAGLCTGIGLNGYTPARIVPLVLLLGVAIYAAHPLARGRRGQMFLWLAAAMIIALALTTPLMRAGLTFPDQFLSRTLTRMTSAEQPLPGPALTILAGNIWNALKMFNWHSGEIWVVSLAHKPALDWISAALFLVGAIFVAARYAIRRHWLDLFTLLSIPLLLAPSILALAFPTENPAPNRASGAIVPAFALVGFALATTITSLRRAWAGRIGLALAFGFGGLALVLAAASNYRMMFVDYSQQYRDRSWNTSAAGDVIHSFAETVGSYATAHVVPYPHWMDTRLVGFEAGRPGSDLALKRDAIATLVDERLPQLFLVHIDDQETLEMLRSIFPEGNERRYVSGINGRDFWIYFVPGRTEGQ